MACQNQHTIKFDKLELHKITKDQFKSLGTLSGTPIPIDATFNPSHIYHFNGRIFLVDIDHTAGMFRIYDDSILVSERIPQGAGPHELPDIWNIQQITPDSFMFYSLYGRKIIPYNYPKDTLYSGIKINLLAFDNPIVFGTTLWVTSGNTESGNKPSRFSQCDLSGNYILPFGELPVLDTTLSPEAYGEAFMVKHDYDPNSQSVVLGYVYTDFLEIYQMNGEVATRLFGPDYFTPVLRPRHYATNASSYRMVVRPVIDETRYATKDLKIAKHKIFWLYDGRFIFQRGKTRSELDDNCTDLYLMDLQGSPWYHLKLDPPLFTFAIAEDSNILYGLSSVNDIGLFKYALPEFQTLGY